MKRNERERERERQRERTMIVGQEETEREYVVNSLKIGGTPSVPTTDSILTDSCTSLLGTSVE